MVVHHGKLVDFASVPFQGTVTKPGCPVAAHCFRRDSLEYARGFRISPTTPQACAAATSPTAATPAPPRPVGGAPVFLLPFAIDARGPILPLLCSYSRIFLITTDCNSVARSLSALRLPIASVAGYRAVPPPVLCP